MSELANKDADAYGVWDTQENKWFFRGPKRAWGRQCDAANAWNFSHATQLFSKQTRYVVKPIRFVAL